MTEEERALRDMWMAEMWRPVREYEPPLLPSKLTAKAAVQGFASCRSCGVVFRQPAGQERAWKLCPECV